MRAISNRFAFLALAFLLAGSLWAGDKTSDPAKAEADYQKFVKDHVGYKLLYSEHDKFKNLTTFKDDLRMSNEMGFEKPDGGGLDITLHVLGIVPDQPTKEDGPAAVLMLTASSPSDGGWRYIDCHDLNWLVDGKPFAWDDEGYDNSVLDDASTQEYFNITLSADKMAKLAKAGKIEAKICNDEFVFTKKQLWVIRWVSEQMQAASQAKTAD